MQLVLIFGVLHYSLVERIAEATALSPKASTALVLPNPADITDPRASTADATAVHTIFTLPITAP